VASINLRKISLALGVSCRAALRGIIVFFVFLVDFPDAEENDDDCIRWVAIVNNGVRGV